MSLKLSGSCHERQKPQALELKLQLEKLANETSWPEIMLWDPIIKDALGFSSVLIAGALWETLKFYDGLFLKRSDYSHAASFQMY